MGTLFTRGGKLYAKIKGADGVWQQHATGFNVDQRDQAERWMRDIERKRDAARADPSEIGPITVNTYALGDWIKGRQVDDLDWKNDLGRLNHHVLPRIGSMLIVDVRAKHLAELVRAIRTSGKLAQRSVYNVWSVVSALFRDAAVAGLIDANPCREIGEKQLGPLTDKDPEWRAGAVFTRAEAETMISDERIPFDRRLFYAFELLAGMRPGEIAARRWRDYDAAVEPLGRLTIASALNTRKYKVKSTKTNTARMIPVHATLAAMLAEWKLSGWEAMMGRAPKPEDLILPLTPEAAAARRSREGEPFRTGDYAGKKWREVDRPMLGWRHRRMYDGKATMITLALDDGADEDIIRTRVTHAKPVENAFDHYYRGTKWLATCAEISKLDIRRKTPGNVIELSRAAAAGDSSSEVHTEFGAVLVQSETSPTIAASKKWRRRESKRSDSSISTSTCPILRVKSPERSPPIPPSERSLAASWQRRSNTVGAPIFLATSVFWSSPQRRALTAAGHRRFAGVPEASAG